MWRRVCGFAIAAGCAAPASEPCGDERYCPAGTGCAEDQVCLVEIGGCAGFADRTPCASNVFGRGHCAAGTCLPGVTVLGGVVEVPSAAPAPDVTLAVVDRPEVPVAVTGPDGLFELPGVPRDTAVVLRFTREGALPTLTRVLAIGSEDYPLDADADRDSSVPIVPPSFLELVADVLDIEIASDHGVVAGVAWDPETDTNLGGATATIAGAGCAGPIYFDAAGAPVPGGTSTDPGNAVFAFVDCLPGRVQVTVTHAGRAPCHAAGPDTPATIEAPTEAGAITFVGRVVCPPFGSD